MGLRDAVTEHRANGDPASEDERRLKDSPLELVRLARHSEESQEHQRGGKSRHRPEGEGRMPEPAGRIEHDQQKLSGQKNPLVEPAAEHPRQSGEDRHARHEGEQPQ